MKDSDGNSITGHEINRITKVAYRPEKNKDCLVVWQNVAGITFERSYHYENYNDAKEDYMNIKTMMEALEQENTTLKKDVLNERG